MKQSYNFFYTKFSILVAIIFVIILQGCATTINCLYESDPPGAQIFGGPTPVNMSYIGTTPYVETFSGFAPSFVRWFYQFKKEGYIDSEIIFAEQLPPNVNRRVWAILVKENTNAGISSINSAQILTGTGWISYNGLIVTNYHVIEDHLEIKIRFSNYSSKIYSASVLLSDKQNDIAVLQLDEVINMKLQGIPISSTNPKIGERVFTIGFPRTDIMGNMPKLTDGIISSLSGVQDDPRIIQTTVPIQKGNSGGPLLNMKGEAVGVTTATLKTLVTKSGIDIPQNVNYAVKSTYVQALLSSLENKKDIPMISLPSSKLEDIAPKIEKSIVQIIVYKII